VPRSAHRFFAENLSAEEIAVSAEESRHAASVLRLRAGEAVELFDGRGGSVEGEIVRISRDGMTVRAGRREQARCRPGPIAHLAFAVPKGKRLDWLLEKATELGAASLQPVIFERSVAGGDELSEHKRRRWLVHCIEAAKQSGLNFLPELRPPAALPAFLQSAADKVGIVGQTGHGAMSFAVALARREPGQHLCLLVGPEGGITEAEQATIAAASFLPVSIGSTVLRIETAALALLAAATVLD
jgi:16S rRNA (uracil1498-N3)-methyltransferase